MSDTIKKNCVEPSNRAWTQILDGYPWELDFYLYGCWTTIAALFQQPDEPNTYTVKTIGWHWCVFNAVIEGSLDDAKRMVEDAYTSWLEDQIRYYTDVEKQWKE